MLQPNPTLTALFAQEFAWCQVQPGQTAAILTEPDSSAQYLAASLTSLSACGARPFQLMLPIDPTQQNDTAVNRGNACSTLLQGFPEVVEMLKQVDFIVDLSVEGLIHSEERGEILKHGPRMLYIREPADALARLLPTTERTQRVDRAVAHAKDAKTMTVTSPAGTDLRVDLAGSLVTGSRGFCAEPGSWANWGQGLIAAFPASSDVNGLAVLAPGDIVFPFYKYVESPVHLYFTDGFVTGVEGSGVDAALIRDYLDRWDDRAARGISHVGWGMHEKALWHALSLYSKDEAIGVDGRAFAGNFLLSTGPNPAAGRHTLCHFDIPMRNCSVFLDGQPVVENGAIVEPTLKPNA